MTAYDPDEVIPELWESRPYGQYSKLFSTSVLRGNTVNEDYNQVEVNGTDVFCGLYRGCGRGSRTSRFVAGNLYNNFCRSVQESSFITEATLWNAMTKEVLSHHQELDVHDSIGLVGVLAGGELLTTNSGDFRAVLGAINRCGTMEATPLTQDPENIHIPDKDPFLVQDKDGNIIPNPLKVNVPIGFSQEQMREVLIRARQLRWIDRFVIFGNKAFWELVSNEDAVELVHDGPRKGAAKKLIQAAMRKRASDALTQHDTMLSGAPSCQDLDDISVIVLFTDPVLLDRIARWPPLSARNFKDED